MAITNQQIQSAERCQIAAATDLHSQIRLIAGPGTGKSAVIERRIHWLLHRSVSPSNIFVISFTRASAIDLQKRIHNFCRNNGRPDVEEVSVSTLHSLALRALRTAHLLVYPGNPCVLDEWELKNIIDKEFSVNSGYCSGRARLGYSPSRCEEIRREYEAYCGTGSRNPANFIPPDPPITNQEYTDYQIFHLSRSQIYSCLLPGEIVQRCLINMRAGTLNPAHLLGIQHLLVDEYQDLNPVDIEFIDCLTNSGVTTFVAGDDDQSIYSFRFASPMGIQLYLNRFPNATSYPLQDCFRSTPAVVNAARTLINAYQGQNRVPKQLLSLYVNSNPPENGVVHLWQFQNDIQESQAVALSISSLIRNGMVPKDIMILLANSRIQLHTITDALDYSNIIYESPREIGFIDTQAGRFMTGILRVVCYPDDYLAYRLILGSRPGIGPTTCNTIASLVLSNNQNYQDIFRRPIPGGIFPPRLLNVLGGARQIYNSISSWHADDQLQNRRNDLHQIILGLFSQNEAQRWADLIDPLPPESRLKEVLGYIQAESNEQKENVINDIFSRIQVTDSVPGRNHNKVQIMTMHGAKGLSAKVVFIPGLEREILPGDRRIRYTGLILEAARMLYVSISRARAACIVSFVHKRKYYGKNYSQTPSQFAQYLNGAFTNRNTGLTDQEADAIIASCNNL